MPEIPIRSIKRHPRATFVSAILALAAGACSAGLTREQDSIAPPCEVSADCQQAQHCRDGTCIEQCASTRDCTLPTDVCDAGACVAAESPTCTAHEQCTVPSTCELSAAARCIGGMCRYVPAPTGSACADANPCTDEDQCNGAGRCVGTLKSCTTPPAPACVEDNARFQVFEGPGACETSSGQCTYASVDIDCADCESACMGATCGDGVVAPTEDCDDGDDNSEVQPNACRPSCKNAHCGDGVIDAGEGCDDGNEHNDGNGCTADCANDAVCGDGLIQDLFERCDDGNAESFDGCSDRCNYLAWETILSPDDTVQASATLASVAGTSLLIVPTAGGYVHALRTTDGERMWRYEVPGAQFLSAAVSLAWNKVVILDDRGIVHAINANQGGAPDATAAWTVELRPGESPQTPGIGLALSRTAYIETTTSIIAVDEHGTIYRIVEQDGLGVKTGFVYAAAGMVLPYPEAMTSPGPGLTCDRCTPTVLSPDIANAGLSLWGVQVVLSDGLTDSLWTWDFKLASATNVACAPLRHSEPAGSRLVSQPVFAWLNQVSVHDGRHRTLMTTAQGNLLRYYATGNSANCARNQQILRNGGNSGGFGATPVVIPLIQTQQQVIYTASLDGSLRRTTWNLAANLPEQPITVFDAGAALEYPPTLSANESVFVSAADGTVHALTGDLEHKWSLNVGDAPIGSPITAGNVLYIVTQSGMVVALERGGQAAPSQWWSRQHGSASNQSRSSIVRGGGCSASAAGPTAMLACLLALTARTRRRRCGK